jgi:TFIIF-interacting CTD phosphatase-like protein
MLDNNIYSFSAQLNNGILINSFYNDKNDNELSNVLNYLNNYILPAEDVRKINEQFFGFKKIVDDINNTET